MSNESIRFHGGLAGALAPSALFLVGVAWLGLAGAPDERGFWPVLLAALGLGILLARDRRAYADAAVRGMGQPIVALMVMAWLLAGVLGKVLQASGMVEALVWLARGAELSGGAFTAAAFLICCAVSTATGTSFGTLLLAAPLLYPAAAELGAEPAVLMGAILGGATFGDNISPVSDTTIASAMSQGAEIGGVVRSRLRYALPAAGVALVAAFALGGSGAAPSASTPTVGSADALPMLLAPALTLWILLRRRHLFEGLLAGIAAAIVLGLALGRLAPAQIFYIDAARFSARGLIIEGMERGLGVTVFTILLMGLVAGLEAAGVIERLIAALERRTHSARGGEIGIFGAVSTAALLTTHSVVAILAAAPFARAVGERFGIDAYRRSNLLDVTVCTWPFLLPYCIPTILAASTTASGAENGLPQLSPFVVGMWNVHSWALLAVIVFAVATGWGRDGRILLDAPAAD